MQQALGKQEGEWLDSTLAARAEFWEREQKEPKAESSMIS
jgi:hypothetical protein